MSLIIKTTENVWEMEKDIILFIDKNDVHNKEYWKDECFRRINEKYPFQELFVISIINVLEKSCAFVYSVYGKSICCLLLNGSQHQRKNENINEKHNQVLKKNNTNDRKSSNKTILRMPTSFIPKMKPVIPTKTAAIELLQSNDDCKRLTMQQPNIPVIKIIPQNIWELDEDIDIILFIDLETIYTDDWEDEVVERVNDHYPFKNRMLKYLQIMPFGSGTVRIYRQNGVSIFCIFFNNRMAILGDWMKGALISIKRMLTGHVQLAIQQDLFFLKFQLNVYSNLYVFFQSVFTYDTVVIWLCGSDLMWQRVGGRGIN